MSDTALAFNSRQDSSNSDLLAVAQLADALGYHTFWTGESWGRDAFTVLTFLACHTRSLRLGTGIINVFSRTPTTIAQSIASLDLLSQGRAVLGLGTSGAVVVEQWHGMKYRQPLRRTREYIEIIRLALSGARVDYQGRLFQLSRFSLAAPPVQSKLPIYVASLGPKNLELTGELADGWLPIWVHPDRLPALKEAVARGAQRAERDTAEVTVAPQILCYVADSHQEESQAEALIRHHMAYYIGGMGSYYYDLFCRYGYRAEAGAVRQAWTDRDRERAAAAISDEMLDSITVFGSAASCRAKLDRFRRNGADLPVIAFPHGAPMAAVRRTLQALAPKQAATLHEGGPA